MNQIRHEQIKRTGYIGSGSALWTTSSRADEDQYLPNARAIEERIEKVVQVSGSFSLTSGSSIYTPSTIVGSITKSGNTLNVTLVPTPSGSGGESTYLSAAFGVFGSGSLADQSETSSYIDNNGQTISGGTWIPVCVVNEEQTEIRLRGPMALLFINGVSQPFGQETYNIVWDQEGYSVIYINKDIVVDKDNLCLLHLGTTPNATYSLKIVSSLSPA